MKNPPSEASGVHTASTPYLVLARKWRPKTFDTLVGQRHVVRALQNALSSGRIPHAFLFSGIRGTGKTTLARLVAKCLLCETGITPEPCGVCSACTAMGEGSHPDVLEIDAASRTKVDQMREVLDTVYYAPATGRFKIYLLDEIHMLTTQSFNALLKTLEEPPAHVKFMFATTEPQKVPATILSRCQRYDLRRVTGADLSAHLSHVLDQEGIAWDAAGVAEVARAADGSVRDGMSLLDQAISHGEGAVRHETVRRLLGLADQGAVYALVDQLVAGDAAATLETARAFYAQGVEPAALVNGLLEAIHQVTVRKVAGAPQEAVLLHDERLEARITALSSQCGMAQLQLYYQVLLRGLSDLRSAELPMQALEMLLLRVIFLLPVSGVDGLLSALGGSLAPPMTGSGTPSPSPSDRTAGSAPSARTDGSGRNGRNGLSGSGAVSAPWPHNRSQPAHARPPRPVDGSVFTPPPPPSVEPTCPPAGDVHLTSWSQWVTLVRQDQPTLGVKLFQGVVCDTLELVPEAGQQARLILRLAHEIYGPPETLSRQVRDWLTARGHLDVKVQVLPPLEGPRPAHMATLRDIAEQHAQEQQAALERTVHALPVVQTLQARFQADLIRVRAQEDASGEARSVLPDEQAQAGVSGSARSIPPDEQHPRILER